MNKLHFLLHLTLPFQESIEKKMGVTGLNVAQIEFKVNFRIPKFAVVSATFFGFLVSHACLLWVAVIFSNNRSTRLFPKLFWIVKMHHTTKIIWHFVLQAGTDYHERVLTPCFKPIIDDVSRRFVYQKAFGVGPLNKKRYVTLMKAWKHNREIGAVGNWAAMVMVRVFLLGITFISNHLNCSGKECVR